MARHTCAEVSRSEWESTGRRRDADCWLIRVEVTHLPRRLINLRWGASAAPPRNAFFHASPSEPRIPPPPPLSPSLFLYLAISFFHFCYTILYSRCDANFFFISFHCDGYLVERLIESSGNWWVCYFIESVIDFLCWDCLFDGFL